MNKQPQEIWDIYNRQGERLNRTVPSRHAVMWAKQAAIKGMIADVTFVVSRDAILFCCKR